MKNIALYIRLSSSDFEVKNTKNESNSIINQRLLIHNFLDNNKEFTNYNIQEFIDDGYTATNDNRPQFKKMLDMAKQKKINIIIVKDFSRFFRNYIEASNYLECIFPFLEIRFISINDNYDSKNIKNTANDFEVAIRNIVYSSYNQDISKKIKSTFENMRQQGKYTGSTPPYGYEMHPTEKHKLIVDEIASKIVSKIFDYALNGLSTSEIATKLNEEQITTSGVYLKEKYNNDKFKSTNINTRKWTYESVYKILINEVYIGNLVSCKRKKENLYSQKTVQQKAFIYPKTHEAIVTQYEFTKAQSVIKRRKSYNRNIDEYALKSKLKCGNCNRNLRIIKHKTVSNIFHCTYSLNEFCKHCKTEENMLESIVLNIINKHLALYKNDNNKNQKNNKKNISKQKLEQLKNSQLNLYEKYANKIITKDVYIYNKESINSDIEKIKNSIENSTNNKNIYQEKLNLHMVNNFIKEIHIHGNYIEIRFNFKNFFEPN